jgi:uncharacterized protein YodC (DUF2158 family)
MAAEFVAHDDVGIKSGGENMNAVKYCHAAVSGCA